MCRRNQTLRWVLFAFGLGVLIGKCVEDGAFLTFLALTIIFAGCGAFRGR